MQLPSAVECDAQTILAKLVKRRALPERLIDARKIIEDYYALAVQDANKTGGSKVGGMVGGAVAIGAITYTGGVSTFVNPIITSLAAMAGAKLTQ